MATADEYEALYREGKEIEAREEVQTPTDFFHLLIQAVEEARRERGRIEVRFDHPTQVRIKVYRLDPYDLLPDQIQHEYTHYL